MWRVYRTAAVLTVLGLAGCAGAAERRFAAQVKNKPAPDFELTALDGAKVRLIDQRGKPVLVAFFAYG
jgi:cytochrome oxidase Cu insertion factor (SCO1/SenC/PrrC family)